MKDLLDGADVAAAAVKMMRWMSEGFYSHHQPRARPGAGGEATIDKSNGKRANVRCCCCCCKGMDCRFVDAPSEGLPTCTGRL